ncbi:hypothetical protein SAY87_000980 [Trapa incisa]|uniref:non-specific serine/threonine protein kinase n=1 Tax=Trapa incisa TaxID=236973 RepID=A0AAN7GSE5_9MYRT|nr:hypothetical protein SAY87_000980 [Trapa incisa]
MVIMASAVARVSAARDCYLSAMKGKLIRYLIYEYAKNGSLAAYIEDTELAKKLTWRKRMDVCVSVARACREFMGHGNLKSANVVLDEYFEAKVSEYRLIGICVESASHALSEVEKDVEDFGMGC